MAAGFAAGVLLIVTEFSAIRYVTTIDASCQELAGQDLRQNCLIIGHESHGYAFAVLGLFVILMTFGAAVGRSRPAAIALLVAGILGLGITLIKDLPRTNDRGGVGHNYADAVAHKGNGFWFELVGSSLAVACGAFLTLRTPPRREPRRARGASGEPAEPEEAPA
jgi:hypothetical protein